MDESLLTLNEVARLLNVSRQWVRGQAAAGTLPGFKMGTSWRFDPDQVARWLTLQGNRAAWAPRAGARRIFPQQRPAGERLEQEQKVDLANLIPARSVAERLDVTAEAVQIWIRSGILPGVHAGSTWQVDTASFAQWLEFLATKPILMAMPRGKGRTEALRNAIEQRIIDLVIDDSWVRAKRYRANGHQIPTWTTAMKAASNRAPSQPRLDADTP